MAGRSLSVQASDGRNKEIPTFQVGSVMPLVTVKPKFQVTIPAKLRRGMNLQEGDVMEATIMGNGILLRPMEIVYRASVADRIAAHFLAAEQSLDNIGRTEDEIMEQTVAEIAESRRERRDREAS